MQAEEPSPLAIFPSTATRVQVAFYKHQAQQVSAACHIAHAIYQQDDLSMLYEAALNT